MLSASLLTINDIKYQKQITLGVFLVI